jgi:hypothetical protein
MRVLALGGSVGDALRATTVMLGDDAILVFWRGMS